MVKLMCCLKRKPGISEEQFHRHWREVHGPLVRKTHEFARYLRKYVQSHTISHSVPGVASPPTDFDGVAELWFDSMEEVVKAYAEPCLKGELWDDVQKFVDPAACYFFVVEEVPM